MTNLQPAIKNTPLYILILSIGAFLLPFIYADFLTHKSGLPKFLSIALISLSSLIAWLAHLRNKPTPTIQFNKLFYLLAVIFIYSLASKLWNPFTGTYQLEIFNFACLLMLTFICMQINKTDYLQLVIFSAVAGGALSTIIAFLQAWGWNPLNYGIPSFPASSFVNKNYLANYVDLLLPVSFSLFVISKNKLSKGLSAIFISVLFSYLIFSQTRASWLALLLVLILVLYFSHKNRWLQHAFSETKVIYVFSIIFLSLSLINSPAPIQQINETSRYNNMYSSLADKKIESSASIRLNAYNNALAMIKENPFVGTGLGSFQIAFRPYSFNTTDNSNIKSHLLQLHNEPLQIIVELGIIGISLYLLFFTFLTQQTIQKLNSESLLIINQRVLQLGLLLSVIASIAHSFLSFPLHMPGSSFLLFMFIGLLLNLNSRKININKKFPSPLIVISLIATYFIIQFYITFSLASFYSNKAIKSIYSYNTKYEYKRLSTGTDEQNCTQAKKYVNQALDTYSNDFHLQARAYEVYVPCNANTKEHLKLANTVLKNNPFHKQALESAALISFNKKNYDKSKAYYQKLQYLYPLDAGYVLLLGHIAVKQKDYINAHKLYLKTLQISPQNNAAQNMINKLLLKGYLPHKQITP